MNVSFWQGKKVLVTGHTGFKGSWLCIWLNKLGADVTGFALKPSTSPSLFELCELEALITTIYGDIRDRSLLTQTVCKTDPDIIIHMAAQPLVRQSYADPVDTYETNVMGTVYLLDAVRKAAESGNSSIKAVVNVTTDKCYENQEWDWGYREIDRLGGHDPYSNSKACSELVTQSYQSSFFPREQYDSHGVAIATARAGNVIGGGDWSPDRLIPDCFRAMFKQESIIIRNPYAIRPWQHVLEPLSGYLMLAQKLYEQGSTYAESWNFGPNEEDCRSVAWVVENICNQWKDNVGYTIKTMAQIHESQQLRLDCSKAKRRLGWQRRWNLDHAIHKIMEWMLAFQQNDNMKGICLNQINEYEQTKR